MNGIVCGDWFFWKDVSCELDLFVWCQFGECVEIQYCGVIEKNE